MTRLILLCVFAAAFSSALLETFFKSELNSKLKKIQDDHDVHLEPHNLNSWT